MNAPSPEACEVKVEGAWRSASIAEASGIYRTALKRCPACRGAVYVLGAYSAGRRSKFTHRRLHSGCPLTPNGFSGTPSPHPDALT